MPNTRDDLPGPKRGALPTPKKEIENATPHIPESGQKETEMPTTTVRNTNIQTPKRGAFPSPRSVLAAAHPHVATYAAPPSLITIPPQISMWGNDVHGDCVTAEEAFAKACNSPEIFITENEVITWATSHGVLEGAYLTQVMQWMQNAGFTQTGYTYDDGPYFSVDWTTPGTLQSAISNGPVKLGIAANQLDAAWRSTGGTTGWFATGFQPLEFGHLQRLLTALDRLI
jgi:hypothetical protein